MYNKFFMFSLFLAVTCFHSYAQESRKIIDSLTYETQSGLPIAASKIYFTDSKFTISGYGETNYINYQGPKNIQSEDLELYMTNMQRFVAYAAYKPINWLVLYAEIFAEYMNDGSNESHFEFQPEIFADFLIHEKFNLRLGTHQAQIGYINNSDEPIMFYTVNRPEVERIIIPSTWIDLGIMTYGRFNKNLKWTASVYQGLDPTDLKGATWIRRGRADALRFNFAGYTLNGSLKYTGFENTEFAITGLYSNIKKDQIESNTYLVSPYVRYNRNNWSFMALGAYGMTDNTQGLYEITQNNSLDNIGQVLGKNVYGYYTEVGYDLLPHFRASGKNQKSSGNNFFIKSSEMKLPVFIRYERLNTHANIEAALINEPVFQSDLTAVTMGVNFNPRRNVVLKTNYQIRTNAKELEDGSTEGNRFELGLGFIF